MTLGKQDCGNIGFFHNHIFMCECELGAFQLFQDEIDKHAERVKN